MYHPHSNYIWADLLSKLIIISLMMLLLVMLIAQLVISQRYSAAQPVSLPIFSTLEANC